MAGHFFDQAPWLMAIEHAFGHTPSSQVVSGPPQNIIRVLQPFLGQGINHAHLSSGGGLDMLTANLGPEAGTIDLRPAEAIAYRVHPARLAFHYIAEAPAESFLYLDLANLAPSGVYSSSHGDAEEVVDLGGANYVDRGVWDQGFLKYDYDGNEVPLPGGSHIAIRMLRGSILFVHHASIWNQNNGTYDGQLQRQGEAVILQAIKGAIERS